MFTPEIEQGQLANGARYAFAHVPNAQFVGGHLLFDVGAVDETEENAGIAHYLEHVILRHGPKMHGQSYLKYFGNMQVHDNAMTSREKTSYFFDALLSLTSEYSDAFVKLMRSPSFDKYWVDFERSRIISEIAKDEDYLDQKASDHHHNSVYKNQPFARDIKGTKEVVERLSAEDLYEFYIGNYRASKAFLAMTGNIDKNKELDNLEAITEFYPKDKIPERQQSVPGVAYEKKQDDQYNQVVISLSFTSPYNSYADRENNIILQEMMYANLYGEVMAAGHYQFRNDKMRTKKHVTTRYQILSDPKNAQQKTNQLLKFVRKFPEFCTESNMQGLKNLHIRKAAENSESYLWRAEKMAEDMYYLGNIVTDNETIKPCLNSSPERVLYDYQIMMKQIPSITFYGNVNAANLPDNNQWVIEAMKI